jgi:hypothetical protein
MVANILHLHEYIGNLMSLSNMKKVRVNPLQAPVFTDGWRYRESGGQQSINPKSSRTQKSRPKAA